MMGIPTLSVDESPQDVLDFLDYTLGDGTTVWSKRRVADGHVGPYPLTHLQLGNKERVDDAYWKKFEPIARAVWAKHPGLVLIVGDFGYKSPIVDPFNLPDSDSGITSLAAHQKLLGLAKELNQEIWFDIHVWTEELKPVGPRRPWQTYVDAIEKLADGARHRVAIFEFNANRHTQQRALANAQAIIEVQRDGRLPFVASANCLQVDGQNDNGWDQGLLFLNPQKAWLQPPGYVWQMISRAYQPKSIECRVGDSTTVDAVATLSDDGKSLVMQVVNLSGAPADVEVSAGDWPLAEARVDARTLAAALDAANSADDSARVAPRDLNVDSPRITLPAHSFSIIRWTRE